MSKVYHAAQQQATQLPLFVLSKVCSKCGIEQPLENFEFRKDTNKYRAHCRTCGNARSLVYKKQYRLKQASLKIAPDPLPPGIKHCPRCKQLLPFADFGHNKATKDGMQNYCKACRKDQRQEFAQEISQQQKRYREKNSEKLQERRRRYYQENGATIRSRTNQYRQGHSEEIRELKKRQYQAKRETIIERSMRYQREHRDAHNAGIRRYSKTPRGKLVSKASAHKRRALQRETSKAVKVDYAAILERDGYWCYICNKAIDPTFDGRHLAGLTFDHEKPLAGKGEYKGTHTPENIHPAHRVCNIRKGTKPLSDLTPEQRRGPDA